MNQNNEQGGLLLIEPFYGGSHQQFVDFIARKFNASLYTLPARKWQWRARVSSLYFSDVLPRDSNFRTLFASSVLNLVELVGLRPDLMPLHKVLYFHENQLVYPVRKQKERDFQFGYNQILSCLVADVIAFNSIYNMESFLGSISTFFKMMPDYRPHDVEKRLRHKCVVLYIPIDAICPFLALEKLKVFSPEIKSPKSKPRRSSSRVVNQAVTPLRPSASSDSKPTTDFLNVASNLQQTDKQGEQSNSSLGLKSNSASETFAVYGKPVDVFQPSEIFTIPQSKIDSSSIQCSSDQNADSKAVPDVVPEATCDILPSPQLSGKTVNLANVVNQDSCQAETQVCDGLPFPNKSIVDLLKHNLAAALPKENTTSNSTDEPHIPLHIIWAHRWEHDKNPDMFFAVLMQLSAEGQKFRLSVLGESFTEVPDIFRTANQRLEHHISHWGFIPSREEYLEVLRSGDVVVSTSDHEFFGISVLEAVACGCRPLCPNKLVYPELFPREYLYMTQHQLYKELRNFCRFPHIARQQNKQIDLSKFMWKDLKVQYENVLGQDSLENGVSKEPAISQLNVRSLH